tara:strand:+ start:19342 stop:19725 length:384 start_codon:yes stop_codon:yes gene_type:complete
MAYFSQERKKEMQPKIKELLKEYGLKGRLSVRHHSSVVLTVFSGEMDFSDYMNPEKFGPIKQECIPVNVYWIDDHWIGKARDFFNKALAILNDGNYDRSNYMTDYFEVGWYVDINIGRWDKPYELTR